SVGSLDGLWATRLRSSVSSLLSLLFSRPVHAHAWALGICGAVAVLGNAVQPRPAEGQDLLYTVWGGGPTYPTGRLAHEDATTGYNIQADAIVRRLFAHTGLRLAATYNEFPVGGHATGAARLASATVNLATALDYLPRVVPYAFAGGGYFYYRSDVRLNEVLPPGGPPPALPPRGTRSASGVDAGVGLRVPLPRFSIILEGRDEYVFFGTRQLNMVPVTLGVAYTYPLP